MNKEQFDEMMGDEQFDYLVWFVQDHPDHPVWDLLHERAEKGQEDESADQRDFWEKVYPDPVFVSWLADKA